MAQMQTISIRVPDEDFQWLLSLEDSTARTPSEKLRALLAKAHAQEAGITNPELCSSWMRALAQPFIDSVAAHERKQKDHSDLVSAVADWIPQIMAVLVSSRLPEKHAADEAVEIEAILAQQCFRLLTTLLRATITSVPATYDKTVLDRYMTDILEIAAIISTRKARS